MRMVLLIYQTWLSFLPTFSLVLPRAGLQEPAFCGYIVMSPFEFQTLLFFLIMTLLNFDAFKYLKSLLKETSIIYPLRYENMSYHIQAYELYKH